MKNNIKELNLNEMENVNGGIILTVFTLALTAATVAAGVWGCVEMAKD